MNFLLIEVSKQCSIASIGSEKDALCLDDDAGKNNSGFMQFNDTGSKNNDDSMF